MISEIGGQRNGTKGIQHTACLRILTFSLSKQEMGIFIPSAILTFVIRDFITYCCQNWHVNMSNVTFQLVNDHSKGNYSYWSKEKKKPHTFEISFWAKISYWILILNIQSGFISKKIFRYWPQFFFHARISVGKIYLFNKGFLSVRRKTII